MKILYTWLTCLLLVQIVVNQPSQQPVIGIYTQDAEDIGKIGNDVRGNYSTYIAASYVKNIEMAGAQVVPIFYHYTNAQLQDLLGKINGVFLPGGEMPIDIANEWTSKLAYILDYAKKQNKLGNNYPVWATCLGYEAVMYVTSGQSDNRTVFTEVTGQDGFSCPLIVKNHDSKLLRSLSNPEYTDTVNADGVFYFHHRWSVMVNTFNNNGNWTNFWKLISTTKTKYGAQFLSTLQAIQFPFFLTQYHPQKNSFQWRIHAKRTYNAISAQQKFINVFISQARKNKNVFPVDELNKKIIYNYQPTLTPLTYGFVQIYIFDQSKI